MRRTGEGLIIGAIPAVLVVIAGEIQLERSLWIGGIVSMQDTVQRVGGALAFGYADHLMKEVPRVQRIEAIFGQVRLVAFGQHEQGLHFPETADASPPKIAGDIPGDIAAKAVYIGRHDPVLHRCDHAVAQNGVVIIQLTRVRPVEWYGSLARAVLFIKVRVLRKPAVIGAGVVRHPVQDHLHPFGMSRIHQVTKIGQRAEFGIDGGVIGYRVIAAQAALSVDPADRIDGHEPQYIHAHGFQSVEMPAERLESALRRILAEIHLIDVGPAEPGRVFKRLTKTGDEEQEVQGGEQASFHDTRSAFFSKIKKTADLRGCESRRKIVIFKRNKCHEAQTIEKSQDDDQYPVFTILIFSSHPDRQGPIARSLEWPAMRRRIDL